MAMNKLMRLAGEIEEITEDGTVTAEALDDLGADLGVPREKLYAALGMCGDVRLKLESEIQIVVCTGGCQEYGSLECLSELLDLRDDRLEDDASAFDVIPKACLNRCQDAAVLEFRTPAGTAVVGNATPALVLATVEDLFAD